MTVEKRNDEWKIGQVKFFDNEKGFGFVNCWDDQLDYFIHISKVNTSPVKDYDYVVFKLGPSRKKPGTFEARNLSLVSMFAEETAFLQEQYAKYNNISFRNTILKSLSSNDILNLFEKEITAFKTIDNELEYLDFNRTINYFSSIDSDKTLKESINSIISTKAKQIASDDFLCTFWLDDTISQQPDITQLASYFQSAERTSKLEIFKRIDTSSRRELVKLFTTNSEPEKLLGFILDHLIQINTLRNTPDVKSKLHDTDFWKGKEDYELFTETIKQLLHILDEEQKLALFFSGYLNVVTFENVLSVCTKLEKEQLEQILKSGQLSRKDTFKIFEKMLDHAIMRLSDPEDLNYLMSVESASDIDWDGSEEEQIDSFVRIFEISNNYLTESQNKSLEIYALDKLPGWIHFDLWKQGYIKTIPVEELSKALLENDNIQSEISSWLEKEIISSGDIAHILKSNIQGQEVISSRKSFYAFKRHLDILEAVVGDVIDLESIIPENNLGFFKLYLWLEGLSSDFNFELLKKRFVFLSAEHQIRFLKKLFWLSHTNQFNLTVEKLSQLTRIDLDIYKINQELSPEIPLDLSIDIVVEAIKSFAENEKFLFDSELFKILIKDLSLNKEHRFKVSELFEKCIGRFEAEFNWERNGEIRKIHLGSNKFYYAIEFEYCESLVEKVKLLPGRKWNPNEKYWGVPSGCEEQVLKFARENRFFIDMEGSNYANNAHLAELKRTFIPNGISFCEGRLAKNIHQTFNREFWWCCNQPCYSNCETLHGPEEWEKYTLLDFLIILGFSLDDGNRVGDYIEKGKYYQFISTINRFNRLLERMYCEECNYILFPVEDSHYAYHRVVRFHCENKNCSKHHNEIYLHHCMNGKCNGIIDSRKSKKCPNGLYICSNEECGCCCSHDMLSKRLQNLITTGGFIHQNLKIAVENKLGHLERAEHYCYQCGELMLDLGQDEYECQDCAIQYDVSRNNFKRPHRNLKQNKEALY